MITDNDISSGIAEAKIQLGTYRLYHPFFVIIRPVITIYHGKKGKKLKAQLKWFKFSRKLMLIKEREEYLVLELRVENVQIDFVLNFYTSTAFEGIIDTPLGHLRVTGKYKKH